MGVTFTKGAFLTLDVMPAVGFQPLTGTQLKRPAIVQTSVLSHTASPRQFKPNFVIIDNKIQEIPSGFSYEIETINSLIEIGNILFKDARSESPEELKAMRSYFKSKYKKV